MFPRGLPPRLKPNPNGREKPRTKAARSACEKDRRGELDRRSNDIDFVRGTEEEEVRCVDCWRSAVKSTRNNLKGRGAASPFSVSLQTADGNAKRPCRESGRQSVGKTRYCVKSCRVAERKMIPHFISSPNPK